MRFKEDGPSLPDEMLQARDEGRVVFFCGAGVSRARAKLVDFLGLAESVISELGVSPSGAARKVLQKAKEIGNDPDVPGLISADRVFSFLEREFRTLDIQAAVAKALKPAVTVDRTSHEILLRLARTPNGRTQLVTTNFDRLFETQDATIRTFEPPKLPQPSRFDDLDGIVYLHGCVSLEYDRASGNHLVLSSSDFGHAYLSDGWAAEFFRDIVRRYVVVFVGYSAEDPPIHYLLEGLRKNKQLQQGIYAFQCAESNESIARWEHKGVTAIPYKKDKEHSVLWNSLKAWAERADDPQRWQTSVINLAMAGPRVLKPHERGQITHIVSTRLGAKAFADAKPPAEWICVFDPLCRYGSSEHLYKMSLEGEAIDPFHIYGLDFDEAPQKKSDESFVFARNAPNNAWDAFAINDADRLALSQENNAVARGPLARNIPALPDRIAWIGRWFSNVMDQSAAVWWAVRQRHIHPNYQSVIESYLSRPNESINHSCKAAWNSIIDMWNRPPKDYRQAWFKLNETLSNDEWSLETVERFTSLCEPFLKIEPGQRFPAAPPAASPEFQYSNLLHVSVECPLPQNKTPIPNKWLHQIVQRQRMQLEKAVWLCKKVGDFQCNYIGPIIADHDTGSSFFSTEGLSGCVINFAALYDQLITSDLASAKHEFSVWCSDDECVFARLRIWASGKQEIASPELFSQILLSLSDDFFWGSYHQRDLLIAIRARWLQLAEPERKSIENRILNGPPPQPSEVYRPNSEYLAWSVLQRLQWLKSQGCDFSFDINDTIIKLQQKVPNWQPESADCAADSLEPRGGLVATNTDYSQLLCEPINSILTRAKELSGRSSPGSLVEFDPFAGLCDNRPDLAFQTIIFAANQGDFPEWAWRTFLNSNSRANDEPSFSGEIATLLCSFPDLALTRILFPICNWLKKTTEKLSKHLPNVFDETVRRFLGVIGSDTRLDHPPSTKGNETRDWAFGAINSSIGHVVASIIQSENFDSNDNGLNRLRDCLQLPGDQRRYAIAVISHHLGWLHSKSSNWTDQNLLSIIDGNDDDDRDAFWDGFFWNPQIPNRETFLRLKDGILSVAKGERSARLDSLHNLSCVLLSAWLSHTGDKENRWLRNPELREILLQTSDDLRSHVLAQFERNLLHGEDEDWEEWQQDALEFFEKVWPRQLIAKSSRMLAGLCDVLTAHPASFVKLFDAITPLLDTVHDTSRLHFHLGGKTKDIIKEHPAKFLQILRIILPENSRVWPYGVSDVLEAITQADETLTSNSHMLELQSNLNAR
ncbi:MAG: SIR2 family protein [Pirellulales bacterium]